MLFGKIHPDSPKKFSETDILKMLESLIEHIRVVFGERVLQQTVNIPMCTYRVPFLDALLLY